MTDFDPLITLKTSIQRALLGEVTQRLVSVTCGLKDRHIQIRAYFAGHVTEEDIERIQFVSTEVISDFPAGFTIEESCLPIDNPHGEEVLDFLAFRRAD
jgi:hypothetical protein